MSDCETLSASGRYGTKTSATAHAAHIPPTHTGPSSRRVVSLWRCEQYFELRERRRICRWSLRDEHDRLWRSIRRRETPRKMWL